jgi:hypothetical protein
MGSLKDHEEHLRSVLDIPAHKGKAVWDLKKDIPLDQNAKVALAYAAKEADFDEEYWIDTDHLLRGILSFPNEASAALQSIFINLDQARIASKSHRAECPAEKSLYHRLFGSPFRAHRVTLAKWLISIFVALLGLLIIRWIN